MPDERLCAEITLRDGRRATVRPLEPTDVERLTAYFVGLSADTRRRYGPHPFDRATAEALCAAAGDPETTRFVAALPGPRGETIIAYMILTRSIWDGDRQRYGHALPAECGCFAPSVADAYQSQGIGIQMGAHVMAAARLLGLRRIILMGGVQATNYRARRLYARLGFRRVGDFWTQHGEHRVPNYDMALHLCRP